MDIPILRHQAASQVAPCAECLLWLSVTKAHEPTLDKVHGAARIHRRSAPGRCRKLSLKFATAANSVTGSRCDVTRLASIPRAEVPPSDSSSRRSSLQREGWDTFVIPGEWIFIGLSAYSLVAKSPALGTHSRGTPQPRLPILRSCAHMSNTTPRNRGHCHVHRHTDHSPAEHCTAH